jgi:ADP-heptose:LPS heptosyltransferase
MSVKSKVRTDLILGWPMATVLNWFTRLLGFFLCIDHSFSKTPKRIIVCKFLGMGSIIQATPLLQTLRKNFPKANITFVSTLPNRSIISLFPFIDDIVCVNEKNIFTLTGSSLRLIFSCWKHKADIYIDLETYSYYSTILATLSAARNRISFFRKENNIRMGLFTHMMYYNSKVPISKAYLQMARTAGCSEIHEELFCLRPSAQDKENILKKVFADPSVRQNKKIIVINVNASELRIERRWSAHNFISLIQKIVADSDQNIVVLVGNQTEKKYVAEINDKLDPSIREKVVNTSGKSNLNELIALIDISDLFITNDTGPMHIAYSLKKPTIALFGPCSPEQYGTMENTICLYKNVYCSPCVHEFIVPPCKGNNECMKQISVDEVMLCYKKIFHNENQSADISPVIYAIDQHALGIVKRK